jgi:Holliday junction DNA helicase RuvA
MIAQVRGTIASRSLDRVVVDCGGVGYRLFVSSRTLQALPRNGEVTLLTELIVRDDAMHLYGFADAAEKDLFGRLITVAGVGPKMALTALSGSSPKDLRRAIATGDAKRFQVVPGIGKKTAERIIVELKERISDEVSREIATDQGPSADARLLAREGLVTLGYELAEAEAMLDALGADIEIREPEELIAAALRGTVTAA